MNCSLLDHPFRIIIITAVKSEYWILKTNLGLKSNDRILTFIDTIEIILRSFISYETTEEVVWKRNNTSNFFSNDIMNNIYITVMRLYTMLLLFIKYLTKRSITTTPLSLYWPAMTPYNLPDWICVVIVEQSTLSLLMKKLNKNNR